MRLSQLKEYYDPTEAELQRGKHTFRIMMVMLTGPVKAPLVKIPIDAYWTSSKDFKEKDFPAFKAVDKKNNTLVAHMWMNHDVNGLRAWIALYFNPDAEGQRLCMELVEKVEEMKARLGLRSTKENVRDVVPYNDYDKPHVGQKVIEWEITGLEKSRE